MKRIFRARDYQPDADQDLDEELQSHLELKVEDLKTQGMSEEEAWAEARRQRFHAASAGTGPQGRSTAAHSRSRIRRERITARFEALSKDIRYAFRRMARSPGFTITAVLSLAIGVGANTAVFSVVNGLFLKPPPYEDPETLAKVWNGIPGQAPSSDVTWSEFTRLREVDDVFTGVAGFDGTFTGVRDEGGTRSAFVETVTTNLFPLMGIEPVLGRSFSPDEGLTPGADPVAILGHSYWVQAFDADRRVVGETIHLSGIPFTIVGVAPPELSALQTQTLVTQVFVPMSMDRALEGNAESSEITAEWPPNLRPVVRLAPGVSLEAAEDRISGIVREVRESEGRTTNQDWVFRLWPVKGQAIEPRIDKALAGVAWFIMAVAGMVLLLACTNLANLFLAKGLARNREMAVRSAIGAGRGRLATQLFTETVLLSVLGGLGGFFLAQWTLDLLFRFQPNVGVTLVLDTAPDVRVFLFTAAMVSLASVLFGLIPALAATRLEVTPALKGEQASFRGRKLSLRGGMVAFQMAVSVVLLTGASLFFHSLMVAQGADPGFRPEGAVSVQVNLRRSRIPESEWSQVREELKRTAAAELGLETLGVSDVIPLLNRNTTWMELPGVEGTGGDLALNVTRFRVDEGYLETMGIPLLAGRGILETDREGGERVVLVNQTGARRFWPGENALGKEIRVSDESYRVAGVVGDVKVEWLSDPPEPTIYLALAQFSTSEVVLVARGGSGSSELLTALRRAVAEVDPDLLIELAQSLEDRVGINLFPIRLAAIYLGTFGFMALLLAAIGLYGVVSLSVSRRTREMGIRMSIGADGSSVVGMVLRRSLRSVAIGSVIGLAIALALATLVRSFLFGVEPADPATLLAVPLVLGSVAVLAALVPARRASKVDPVEALRTE